MTISTDLPDHGDPDWDVPVNAKLLELINHVNREWINVRDVGVIGDGSTDDTAAIQAAIDSAPYGGTVFFPQGAFKVTGTIDVNNAVTLLGSGVGATTFFTNQGTGNVLELGDVAGIRNLSVRATVTRTAGAMVLMSGAQAFVDFCSFAEYYIGVQVGTTSDKAELPRIRHCVFTGTITSAQSGGIFLCNFADARIEEITMAGPAGTTQPSYGIRVWDGDTWFVNTVNIVAHGYGLLVDPPSGDSNFAGYISNGMFDSPWTISGDASPSAVYIVPGSGGFAHDLQFSNCWFGNSHAGSGLLAIGSGGAAQGIQISNSLAVDNGYAGLRFVDIEDFTVTGGECSANENYGISIETACSKFTITGVRSGPSDTHSAFTQDYGINLSATAHDQYSIVGNNLVGNSNTALLDQTTGSPTRIVKLNVGVSALATTTVDGDVELATSAETIIGTDAVRAVTPAGVRAAVIPQLFNIARNARFRVNQRSAASGTSLASGAFFIDGWKSGAATNAVTWTGSDQAGRTLTIPASKSIVQTVEQADVSAGTYRVITSGTAQVRVYNTGDSVPSYAASGFDVSLTGAATVVIDVAPGTISWIAVVKYTGLAPTVLPEVSFSDELVRCQRYYWQIVGGANFEKMGIIGYQLSTVSAVVMLVCPVDMRAVPTVTFAGLYFGDDVTFQSTLTSLVFHPNSPTTQRRIFMMQGGWSGAAGAISRPGSISATGSTALIALSAEL